MVGFSLTLPATRLASGEIEPLVLGLGRGVVAGALAGAWLLVRKKPLPAPAQLRGLALVALGVVLGFPLLTSLALQDAPAQRAVLMVGLLPLSTSVFAALRNRERLSLGFWTCTLLGASAVFSLSLRAQGFSPSKGDALLVPAVVLAGLGYAEGGRISQQLGGFAVICWALVLALPFTVTGTLLSLLRHGMPSPGLPALLCFGYVSLVSALLGFSAWYRGLALGGVARGSQVQLLQPVLSLGWCALLLAEPLSGEALLTGAAVLASAIGSRMLR